MIVGAGQEELSDGKVLNRRLAVRPIGVGGRQDVRGQRLGMSHRFRVNIRIVQIPRLRGVADHRIELAHGERQADLQSQFVGADFDPPAVFLRQRVDVGRRLRDDVDLLAHRALRFLTGGRLAGHNPRFAMRAVEAELVLGREIGLHHTIAPQDWQRTCPPA